MRTAGDHVLGRSHSGLSANGKLRSAGGLCPRKLPVGAPSRIEGSCAPLDSLSPSIMWSYARRSLRIDPSGVRRTHEPGGGSYSAAPWRTSVRLERLAGVACFSPFHFHRLFRAWMGETLQVSRPPLEIGARSSGAGIRPVEKHLRDQLDCGFTSSGAFARAFKGAYGVPASEWRKRKNCETNRKPWEALEGAALGTSETTDPLIRSTYCTKEPLMTSTTLNVQVRQLAPATIAYIRHVGPYKGTLNCSADSSPASSRGPDHVA